MTRACQTRVRTAYEHHRLTLALSSLRLSQRDVRVDDSQRDAVASLQMMSEASGVESGAEQSEVRATSTDRVLRSRTRVKKDVNFIPEDENVSAYESFSSGESDGEVLDKEDEDDVCRDRVGEDALDKCAVKQREDALRAMQWNPVSSAYEEGVLAYPGLDAEDAQPVAALRHTCVQPTSSICAGPEQEMVMESSHRKIWPVIDFMALVPYFNKIYKREALAIGTHKPFDGAAMKATIFWQSRIPDHDARRLARARAIKWCDATRDRAMRRWCTPNRGATSKSSSMHEIRVRRGHPAV
ncbi:hypothetical protein GQ600_13860 [Phytophthora cactorum]|nr:hypothetical protein GQ600_13860 [Phytophthora cactorum]